MTAIGKKYLLHSGSALTAVVLLAGLVASAAGALWWSHTIDNAARADFERSGARVAAELTRRLTQPVYGLMGAKGMYAADPGIRRAEFGAYVESRDLPRELPGVLGFGFIQRVGRRELPAFIARAQADGAARFALRQLADKDKDDLFIVKYIEPAANNAGAMGLDLGSEGVRREGLERAVDTGEPTISGLVTLVQADQKTPGVLLFVPIYTKGSHPSTPAERRAALFGLVYAPIVMNELLRDMPDVASGHIDFELFDGQNSASATRANGLLFDADQHLSRLAQGGDSGERPRFTTSKTLGLLGRDLVLQVNSTRKFENGIDRAAPWWVGAAGALLSVLLALLLREMGRGRERAELLARRMTADLDRLAQVVKHTFNAVSISDREGRITWINEGFTRANGYTLADAAGKAVGELLGNPKADLESTQALAHAVATGRPCRAEILNKTKDGRDYWVDTEVQPMHDAQGLLTGFMEISSDVTARRDAQSRLESALRDNSALLSTLNLHAIVSVSNRAGTITDINEAFCKISGYTRDELLGQNHRIVNSGTQGTEFWANVWRAIASGTSWRGDVCNRAKDGTLYWVDTFIAPFIGDDGTVDKYIAIRTDITANKDATRELARERQRLDNIISGTNVGTWEWDVETGTTVYDERWQRLTGYTPDELGPTTVATWGELVHPDDLRRSAALWEAHFSGETPTYECEVRVRHKDGHWVWVLDRGKLFGRSDDGRPRWAAGTHMEITARKLAEEKAERNALLLRGAIDAIDEAFVLYDPTDRLVYCNDKYREIYAGVADLIVPGASFENIIRAGAERGHYTAAVGRVDEWVAERLAAHLTGNATLVQRLESGRTLRIIERKLPDGHIVGFRIDITELVQATEAAQQASLAKSQFLANMSHELRTPMNAVLGMLTLLRKTELSPRQSDYAAKSDDAARALLSLLDEILDFSKIEAGKMALDPMPFRMDQLLRDLSIILSTNLGDKPVEVVFDIDPTLPRALIGDAMRLQQVLINLSGNAIKFTAQGEVVLSIAVVAQDSQEATLKISVRDSGIGITPENQARIFSGFTQAEASTTRRFGGTGLGVAISQRFVELMGGELRLDSAVGKGSEFYFTITLPVSPQVAMGPQQRAQLEAVSFAAPWRTLVVDDNPIAREVLERMGKSLGWSVDVADSGESALLLLQSQAASGASYQALFIDWNMPGLDGWQTCERIRSMALPGVAPVIIMVTAHGREILSLRSDADQALMDGFLVKPITTSMMFDAVVDARNGHQHAHPSQDALGSSRLPGLRVLLVEDNLNNQQVARELLEGEGALVQVANDGQEGLDAIAAASPGFDVVLMDLQMPVMDGLTACRSIRQNPGLRTLPIVAMTANAMASDREECLAAGMNDHVGKPFDLDHLVGVLRKQTGQAAVLEPSTATAVMDLPYGVAKAAHTSGVDLAAALKRLGGKLDVYQRMLRNFVTDLATMPEQLRHHAAQPDPVVAVRLLHTLKGLAATLGATTLSADAAQGEKQLTASTVPATAATVVAQACAAIGMAIPGLTALLQAMQEAQELGKRRTPEPYRPEPDREMRNALRALSVQLENSDMEAMQLMADLRLAFGEVLGEQLEPLEAAIAELDFDRALPLCIALLESQTL